MVSSCLPATLWKTTHTRRLPLGSVPIRREIRELQSSSPDLFNLYLLGLRAYQAQDEEQLTSYYQIAGIHGMPYKPWDNVQGISDWDFGGYCTHSSVLFVPWHRPYLALFEASCPTWCILTSVLNRHGSNACMLLSKALRANFLPTCAIGTSVRPSLFDFLTGTGLQSQFHPLRPFRPRSVPPRSLSWTSTARRSRSTTHYTNMTSIL